MPKKDEKFMMGLLIALAIGLLVIVVFTIYQAYKLTQGTTYVSQTSHTWEEPTHGPEEKMEQTDCVAVYEPVCAQLPMPECPGGQVCAQVMPAQKTFSSTCEVDAAGAEVVHKGECNETSGNEEANTYTSEEFEFSFDYPKELIIKKDFLSSENGGGSESISLHEAEEGIDKIITLNNSIVFTCESLRNKEKSEFVSGEITAKDILDGSHDAETIYPVGSQNLDSHYNETTREYFEGENHIGYYSEKKLVKPYTTFNVEVNFSESASYHYFVNDELKCIGSYEVDNSKNTNQEERSIFENMIKTIKFTS